MAVIFTELSTAKITVECDGVGPIIVVGGSVVVRCSEVQRSLAIESILHRHIGQVHVAIVGHRDGVGEGVTHGDAGARSFAVDRSQFLVHGSGWGAAASFWL